MRIDPRRIIGVVADMDDVNLVPKPTMTVFTPLIRSQTVGGGRMFVHTRSDPYALVTPITRIIRTMSADQPVERAATLEDVRAEVLSSDRLNVVVFGVFAGVALLIAVVGVAGVLAFSVSGRTREFGIRLAVGSQPRHLLLRVIAEGAGMAIGGLAVGIRLRVWTGATGRHFSGRSEDAGRAAGGRFGFGVAACRRDCVGDTRRAGRSSRRDAGAANGVKGS